MSQAQILVVDDEPDIRQLVKEILEDEGYSVQVAKDGENARLTYAQQKPDLVLLDIWMPDIDGISLLKEWSSAGSLDSQVVIMSGHGTLETAVEATRLAHINAYARRREYPRRARVQKLAHICAGTSIPVKGAREFRLCEVG